MSEWNGKQEKPENRRKIKFDFLNPCLIFSIENISAGHHR